MMATNIVRFNINEFNTEQQNKFDTVYNDLKSRHQSYLEYKRNSPLKIKLDEENEENEWRYELHRFLRARKWNTAHTIKSILEMVQWRIDNHVDSILDDESIIVRMEFVRQMIPGAYHGYTKVNRPLYIEKPGQMDIDDILSKFTAEELVQCHVYSLEYSCKLARDRSRQLGQHIESFANIYDIIGMKMDIRKLLNACKQSLYIDDNYYPERLGQMFIVNPPVVFPAIWNLVKHFIDPVTKRKIIVMKKGTETATLLQHIDSDQLPSEYGGTCHTCPTSPDCVPMNR